MAQPCSNPGCDVTSDRLMVCSACKTVAYCSSACQRADWGSHKSACKAAQAAAKAAAEQAAQAALDAAADEQAARAAAEEATATASAAAKEAHDDSSYSSSSSSSLPLRPSCAQCGSGDGELHNCSACKTVSYCSRDCQLAHWATHKQQCKTLAAARKKQDEDAAAAAATLAQEARAAEYARQRAEQEAEEAATATAAAAAVTSAAAHQEEADDENEERAVVVDEPAAFATSSIASHAAQQQEEQQQEVQQHAEEEQQPAHPFHTPAVVVVTSGGIAQERQLDASEQQQQHHRDINNMPRYAIVAPDDDEIEPLEAKPVDPAIAPLIDNEAKPLEGQMHPDTPTFGEASGGGAPDANPMIDQIVTTEHDVGVTESGEVLRGRDRSVIGGAGGELDFGAYANTGAAGQDAAANRIVTTEHDVGMTESGEVLRGRDRSLFGGGEVEIAAYANTGYAGQDATTADRIVTTERDVGVTESGEVLHGRDRRVFGEGGAELDFAAYANIGLPSSQQEANNVASSGTQQQQQQQQQLQHQQILELGPRSAGLRGAGGAGTIDITGFETRMAEQLRGIKADILSEIADAYAQQKKREEKLQQEDEEAEKERTSTMMANVASGLSAVLAYQRAAAVELEKHMCTLRNADAISKEFSARFESAAKENECLKKQLAQLRCRLLPTSASSSSSEGDAAAAAATANKVRLYAELGPNTKLMLPTTLQRTVGEFKSAALERAAKQGFIPASNNNNNDWSDWYLSLQDGTVLFDDDHLEDVGCSANEVFKLSRQAGGSVSSMSSASPSLFSSSPVEINSGAAGFAHYQQQQQQQQQQQWRPGSGSPPFHISTPPVASPNSVASNAGSQQPLPPSSPSYSVASNAGSMTSTAYSAASPQQLLLQQQQSYNPFSPTSVISTTGSSAPPSSLASPLMQSAAAAEAMHSSTLLLLATVLDKTQADNICSNEALERRLNVEVRRMELEALEAEERSNRRALRLRRIQNVRARLMDKCTYGGSDGDRAAARQAYAKLNSVVEGMNSGVITQQEVEMTLLHAEVVLSREPTVPSPEENARVAELLRAEELTLKERTRLVVDIKDLCDLVKFKLPMQPEKFRESEDLLNRATTIASMMPLPATLTLKGMIEELTQFIRACQSRQYSGFAK